MRQKRAVTISEAAVELGISRAAVWEAIKRGRLEAKFGEVVVVMTKRSRGWLVSKKSLRRYRVSQGRQDAGRARAQGAI